MPILNYRTTISVTTTINEITRCLSMHGAAAILSEFDGKGEITAISFKIKSEQGYMGFKLPADWRPVLHILQNDERVRTGQQTEEHARRVAWRIVKDWVLAQMAILETNMVKFDQVFLPYMIVGESSFYEESKKILLKLLGGN